MRIKKNINLRIISWSNTKFSELTLYKNWMVDSKENYKFDLGVRGLTDVLTAFWCPLRSVTEKTKTAMWNLFQFVLYDKKVKYCWPCYSQDLISNFPYCLPYNSCDVSLGNLVLDQLIIL